MLVVVSPAKKLNFEDLAPFETHSQPDFLDHSEELIDVARKLTRADLGRLMKISDTLADLNYQRYQAFSQPFDLGNAKQAALAFSGDTYVGLDASSLSEEDFAFAQNHFRILSGLYGLLRPLDLMQPYRLEMGTRLQNDRGSDLYSFWGDIITNAINEALESQQDKTLINCASNEYFKAVRPKKLVGRVITPVFKEIKAGQAKVLGMFAKRARGMMARYVIENRLETPEGIKDFTTGGYQYRPDLSNDSDWVFTREQP
ncbi:peroxide stress protein YaaA [Aestuariispira ectoiniformans]|uniref:peroxide stress protein YaaA n=1 Tax=Aestuariispira ectoiniformans TaxID=2775080 RepID=UPI00223B2398|nr:peroxide stress protein YaaA [Aestuariispira ectoiniformans]